MRVEFSKEFIKAVQKLSGKVLNSVRSTVQYVIDAESIDELPNCKKYLVPRGQAYDKKNGKLLGKNDA